MRTSRGKAAWRTPALLAFFHVLLALAAFDPTPYTGGDNASYVALARALLERGAYLELWDPATPPHTQYPPVFAGILALAMGVGVRPWVGLKLLIIGFSTAAVVFSYLWLRRRTSPRTAAGIGAVLAATPGVLDLSHWVLSDVPFWAFVMLALWAWERARPGECARATLGAAATTLSYFTRSAGLPLVVAVGGWLLLRRRWRDAALLGALFLPAALLWWLRARSLGTADYVGQFWMVNPYQPDLGRIGGVDLVLRVAENIRSYLEVHLAGLLFWNTHGFGIGAGMVLTLLALFGWARALRRPGIAELFFPLYAGLILAWPAVWSGHRFLLPLLPLLLLYAVATLRRLAMRFGRGAIRWAGELGLAALVLLAAPALFAGTRQGVACTRAYLAGNPYPCLSPEWGSFFEIARRSRNALPPGTVVLSRKPSLFYALSGHPGRLYPLSEQPQEFFRVAAATGASYVVFDQLSQLAPRYLLPALSARPAAFCTVNSMLFPYAALLRIRPDAPWEASGDARPREFIELALCPDEASSPPPD